MYRALFFITFTCPLKKNIVQEEKAKKIADLEEQLRDLMFYLETQQRVENSPNKAEIQQGQVIVRESEVKKSPSRRNK